MLTFIKNEKAWLLSHLVWIVAIAVGLLVGRVALREHDARVLSEAQVQASEKNVANLRWQIATTDKAAEQKAEVVTKIVHDAVTPSEQIAALPQLSDVPLNARLVPALSPNGPPQAAVDLAPLIQELGECKTAESNLGACKSDLQNEKAIASDKDTEITALKKKPKFFTRVKHGLELFGAGAVTVVLFFLVHHA
jgi:hypothetical protein